MRRFVLGTAGHVDHGKTTLVRALTGVDTDRLPEEKRRGITIELGFAAWDLGDGLVVSLIDVPGHRRLVHTMIAGAIGMELVLLVVAADEGVMPQTREHVAACELLGIRRAVVAVTKLDRVGAELAALAGEEAQGLLAGRFESEVVLCSGRTGEGVPEVGDAVRRALLALGAPRDSGRARLSVDRVFSVKGAGTVVTGTLVEGKIAVGAPLLLVGESKATQTSARGLHVHDRGVQLAEAPTRLAVNLAGLPLEDVHRGDVVTDDASARTTRTMDVAMRPLARVKQGQALSVYVGTARSPARINLLGASDAEVEGSMLLARLRLGRPMVVLGADRFVARGSDIDGPSGAVVGGGIVLDAEPPRKRARAPRRAVVSALERGSANEALSALVDESAPRPLPATAIASRFVLPPAALRQAADRMVGKGELAAIPAHRDATNKKGRVFGWMKPETLVELAGFARKLCVAHHQKSPLDRGLVLATLRQRLTDRSGPEAAEEAIRLACSKSDKVSGEQLVVEGDIVKVASFGGAPIGGAAFGALGKATQALSDAALKGMGEHAMSEATGSQPREVKAILAKLVRDGVAIHAGELWFSRASVDVLKTKVAAFLDQAPRMTIAEFKELSGLGRKQAIVLLETLDRDGVTKREGDDRVRGAR